VRIAITTPTGNIGSKLTELLLNDGKHDVVLLARDAAKLQDQKGRGAEVHQGDLADADFVKRATEGADVLYWVCPPKLDTEDFIGYCRTLAENAVAAIKAHDIKRAALLSSIGGHLSKGVGPVNGLHHAEQIFRQNGANLLIFRPTFFMENFLPHLPSIKEAKAIFMPVSGEASVPMIATRDIAAAAARELIEPFTGQKVIPLHGPKDYTFNQAARIIGDAIGEEVKFVRSEREQMRQALQGFGATEHAADVFLELYDAIDSGYIKAEFLRTKESTTPTTLEKFAEREIAPLLQKV
jgi:uncharacterized protein YbjT (DUF2867 family)